MSKHKSAARRFQRLRNRLLWSVPVAVMAIAGLRSDAAAAVPDCQAAYTGGPLFITPYCVDPALNTPYIDVTQPGQVTDPATGVTVNYTYVHGGFTGTTTKFAFYFPLPRHFKGWFVEGTYPTVTQEGANPPAVAPGGSSPVDAASVVFAISHGAYYVSTNNNGGVPAGGALAPYRANAASANFSRVVAARLYGKSVARPRGFIYGASGGAYQTLGAAENTRGIYDGSVPMVQGVPNSIPSFQTTGLLAYRRLASVLPQIADAEEAGGSGNPFAGLTPGQKASLIEITKMGFPLRGWWLYANYLNISSFLAVTGSVTAVDPTYTTDFWTNPAYEGNVASVKAARVQANATIESVPSTTQLVLDSVPSGDLTYANLTITSGPLAGTVLPILSTSGNTVTLATDDGDLVGTGTGQSPNGITPGTTVSLDNSNTIAFEYFQRHELPTPDEYGWNQYRNAEGQPLYVQRPYLVGPILDASTAGSVSTGKFYGHMIALGSAMDDQAFPWPSDWYYKQAVKEIGPGLGRVFRLWYMDNADHDPPGPAQEDFPNAADHIVSYIGEYEQALLYLNDWVANGTPPPATTSYKVDSLSQIQLAATAAQRNGVQPVVSMTSGGASKVTIAAGGSVSFDVTAQMPPNAGNIVDVAWDLQGSGTFTPMTGVPTPGTQVSLTNSATFATPGTYFATVRIYSARPGANPTDPYALVQNISSVRVVVH